MATATTAIGSIQFEIPRQSLAAGETAEFDCLIAPQQKIYGAGLYVPASRREEAEEILQAEPVTDDNE